MTNKAAVLPRHGAGMNLLGNLPPPLTRDTAIQGVPLKASARAQDVEPPQAGAPPRDFGPQPGSNLMVCSTISGQLHVSHSASTQAVGPIFL